jgi:hypothetical protein
LFQFPLQPINQNYFGSIQAFHNFQPFQSNPHSQNVYNHPHHVANNGKTVSWRISAYANKKTKLVDKIKNRFNSYDDEQQESDQVVRILNNGS